MAVSAEAGKSGMVVVASAWSGTAGWTIGGSKSMVVDSMANVSMTTASYAGQCTTQNGAAVK